MTDPTIFMRDDRPPRPQIIVGKVKRLDKARFVRDRAEVEITHWRAESGAYPGLDDGRDMTPAPAMSRERLMRGWVRSIDVFFERYQTCPR